MVQMNYFHWLHHPNTQPELKEQLKRMNEQEILDSFYTTLEFGTAGMRGLLGAGTNRMNVHTVRKASQAFATYLVSAGAEAMKRGVVIAYDNRHFSKEFALESARVLAMNDITAYVFSSLRPTPELSFAVRHLHCFGGIVITASHNPKEYNGYKLYDEQGCQLIPSLVEQVIQNANAIVDELDLIVALTQEQEKLIHFIDEEVDHAYLNAVKGIQVHPNQSKDISIVFTPQHGTARHLVESLFTQTGYSYILVKEQAEPDPDFSNTKTPNPEEVAAYELALSYATKYHADLVLSTDPDADRVGIAVLHQGTYHLMSGNQTGSVLMHYLLSQKIATNTLPEHPVVFNTVVTSDLGEKIAKSFGVDVEKTLTGFKFIGEKIQQHEINQDKQFVFGYEESYGYLIEPFVRDKDAMQACLIIAEAANFYKSQQKSLIDVLEELYQTHGWYQESQVSFSLAGEAGAKRIAEITALFRNHKPESFGDVKVVGWEDYQTSSSFHNEVEGVLAYPVSDVLKFFLADGSWIAIRPSGTEPKCKFYYCVSGVSQSEIETKTTIYQKVIASMIA